MFVNTDQVFPAEFEGLDELRALLSKVPHVEGVVTAGGLASVQCYKTFVKPFIVKILYLLTEKIRLGYVCTYTEFKLHMQAEILSEQMRKVNWIKFALCSTRYYPYIT